MKKVNSFQVKNFCFLLLFTFVAAPRALNANDWPYTQGKVTQSELIERKRSNRNSDIITVYSAKLHYQYTVDGKTYSNMQVRWADRSKNKIQSLISREYPTDAVVTIFYNPQNPEQAVLEQELGLTHMLIGLFLLISICLMAWALYRNANRRRSF